MSKGTFRIADLFCGAGGTSTGAIEAVQGAGYSPSLLALNHNPTAIDTLARNHPEAQYLCSGIDDANPRHIYKPGELNLLWASPECTHHSVARGGKPISDQSRSTAWCVIRWAEALLPPVILVENVPEFVTWGPLCARRRRPLASKRGEIFRAWVNNLCALGYKVEWRILCAADYGDPTTRKRLFVQAVRGRRKCVWPEPTHGDGPGLKPWVPARAIIDWSLPGTSIFSRKKPLSDKTMKRIWAGLRKFGLRSFIVPSQGDRYPRSADMPLQTVCTTAQGIGLVEPFVISAGGPECPAREVSSPLGTVLRRDHRALVEPFLVELRGTEPGQIDNSPRSVEEPVSTITAGGGHFGLCDGYLVQVAHGSDGVNGTDERRSRALDEPVPTVVGSNSWALCEPFIIPQQSNPTPKSLDEPLPTVVAEGSGHKLVEPFIIPIDHTGSNSTPAQSVDNPLSTVTTERRHAVVEPFLVEYYGTGSAESINEPVSTVTTKPRFGLVRPILRIKGRYYELDIRFRMLQPHELALAQGFRPDYQFAGNKTEQVKQIGNAVPRRLARALVAAAVTQNPDVRWLDA